MDNKQVYVNLGFDRTGNLVELRRNGEVIPFTPFDGDPDQDTEPVGTSNTLLTRKQNGSGGTAGDGAGGNAGAGPVGPGSDPCIVRLPSGQLIRIC